MVLPACISILVIGHGKTVSNSSGTCNYENSSFLFVDIPGTYSIMSTSEEEEIARNYICFGNPDATIVVVDATSLERNLNLVFQIMEVTSNIIVCVNLLDEAKKKGIKINLKELQSQLNCPVVGTIATKKKTLNKLLTETKNVCTKKDIKPKLIKYPEKVEKAINSLLPIVRNYANIPQYLHRWVCLKLIDNEPKIIDSIESNFKVNFSKNEDLKRELNKLFSIQDTNQQLAVASRVSQNTSSKKNFNSFCNLKDEIVTTIVNKSAEINRKVCTYTKNNYTNFDRKIDKVITSKIFGIPIMILFLGVIFYLTICGSNYPSSMLFEFFEFFEDKLLFALNYIHCPEWLTNMLVLGIYKTVTWIVSVMLPPMAIFFPLFTFLEDLGFLPRLSFNVDGFFKKAGTSGKQMITMCMGFGCNAAGVVGTRIIDSPRERIIAAITNAFVPCNGRYPFLIAIGTIFISGSFLGLPASVSSTLVVIAVILLGIILTLAISKLLSNTILKGMSSSFILELPPYRKPQIGKILIRSIFDRTIFVLIRAIEVAIPASIVIWLFANISIGGDTLLTLVASFLDPFAKLMGLDGYILVAFIFGMPANEIVLPIILMCYLGTNSLTDISDYTSIGKILTQHGWTIATAINVMIFTVLHFPCTTTLLTIKKETGSLKWTALSFLLPTVCGIILCVISNFLFECF